jgi:cellulose synthase/poly-beta-1,6-N-acetylglucosamine synthase-like glycosyltransferase
MIDRLVTSKAFQKFGELLIPFFSWVIILLPLWLSPFHPAVVAYLIIAFDLYFLAKSFQTTYYATLSYTLIKSFEDVPFSKNLLSQPQAQDIQHFIIIPNYKEPIYKLSATIKAMATSDYPYKNLHLVLAFEKREEEAKEKAQKLKELYKEYFKDILFTYHVLKPHEAPGKASNQTHAAFVVEDYCAKNGYDLQQTMITICDADSMLPPNYFSYMTYEFLKDPEKLYHFYWAPVLLYNNFWQLPFFVRMQATLSSIVRLGFLPQKDLIQLSTYSTNLWLLKEVGYWDVDIIPEDWHIYFQAFFKFGEKVRTLPLYTIINGDAVYSGNLLKTFVNRYEQEKRWAWGVTDIAYFWNRAFTTPHISTRVKLKRFLTLAESHLLWPTSFFILTVSGWIPPLVNPVFKRTVLGFILPQLSGFILTVATALLVLYVYLDIKLRQKLQVQTRLINLPILLVQWYLLPVVSFVLSSLPALDAHTRLLIGKKITYKVTEKV